MIKSTLICRSSDGLVLCQNNDYTINSKQLQDTKLQIKKHQKQIGNLKQQTNAIKQIQSKIFGIYFKKSQGVTYTIITDISYPPRLAFLYIDNIISSFVDEMKNVFTGSSNLRSKLQTIQSSHFFVRFDRIIKLKKQEFQDVKSSKNIARMKSNLDSIKQTVKISMQMIEGRTKILQQTQNKARKLSQDANKFNSSTKKLALSLWFKKNLFWFVLLMLVGMLFYLKFM